MPSPEGRIQDVLVVPLPLLLSQTAQAVAEAQAALDETSMRIQQQLELLSAEAQARAGDEPAGLARFQVDATWYAIPEVEVEMKMSLTLQTREEARDDDRTVIRPLLRAIPHNARSRNLTSFEAEGTSRMTARIVAVPPPGR